MARLPAAEATEQDYERAADQAADMGLFAVGGSFENYPGAVLVAGRNGMVLGANASAEALATLLRQGGSPEVLEAINSALRGRAAQVNPLLLTSSEDRGGGEGAANPAYDLAVLPWCDGTAALLLARDITLERSLRSALIESRQRYKDLVEASSDFAWETDAEGRFTFFSSHGALGYSSGQLVGALARELEIDHAEGHDSPFVTNMPVQEVEVWVRQADGESACLLATALPLMGTDGNWCGARGLCRNITAERTRKAVLAGDRHRERLLAYILGIVRGEMDPAQMLQAAAGALVPALPATGGCIYRRRQSGEMMLAAQAGEPLPDRLLEPLLQRISVDGHDEAESVGEEGALFAKATHSHGICNGVLCLWRAGGSGAWNEEDRALLGEISGQVGLANQQLERQQELEELSSTDPLTGLLNRRGFMNVLGQRYARASDQSSGDALFFIDMDNFKQVNDRHGHQQGDKALVTLARILRQLTRSRDLVARLGGDEFAVFMQNVTPAVAEQKGRELLLAGEELKAYSDGADAPLGLSIGVALCNGEHSEDLQAIIDRADRAMYRVKRRGKGALEVAPPGDSPRDSPRDPPGDPPGDTEAGQ